MTLVAEMLYVLAFVSALFAVFPFTCYPATLLALSRVKNRRPYRRFPTRHPSISLVFCAHNEEQVIENKIQNVLAVSNAYLGDVEALAYLDGCTDKTGRILAAHAGDIGILEEQERRGKSYGIKRLMEKARGEIVVFNDANAMMAENALSVAASYFDHPDIGCLCGHLILVNPAESPTAAVGSAYWRFEEWLKQMETDTGSTMGADGSLFAIRRELFRPPPDDLIDDMHTSLMVLLGGWRVVRAPEFVAYETVTVRSEDEFRRKIRIACRAFNCFRSLAPSLHRMSPLNVYKLYGHKVLRWLTIMNLGGSALFLALALAMEGRWMTLGSLVCAGSVVGVILTALRDGFVGSAREAILALVATGWGVLESCRGKRYQTWSISASSRPSGSPDCVGG
jgi:cellulose synthase/poly-beta-1,6-N-acetylglucosamine synthase-like glycosyltransferase